MLIQQLKTPLVLTWLLLLVIAGLLGNFGLVGWTVLGVLALAPFVVLRQIRRGPSPTLSETIQDARR